MKFYTYKNNEIAFFENKEKMLITKEEKEDLTKNVYGSPMLSFLGRIIDSEINESQFCEIAFSKILKEYRKGEYTIEKRNINEWTLEVVRKNGIAIALKTSDNEGNINICTNTDSWFEDAKKECGVE